MYNLTWIPPNNGEHQTVRLRDITPDDLLNAAAELDIPTTAFSDQLIYRTLYAACFQLLTRGDAEVCMDEYGSLLVVPRAV